MAFGDPKVIHKKWYEVDKLEHETFPTLNDYHVIIQREAIPIVFVPGIMGSRLYQKGGNLIWDPDDAKLMKKTFLSWGGAGQKSPEERLQVLVGKKFDPNYLQVAGTDDGTRLVFPGKYSEAVQDVAYTERSYWDWARRDQRVTQEKYFDEGKVSSKGDISYGLTRPSLLPWDSGVDPLTNEDLGTLQGTQHESKLTVINGWAGISWKFYGKILTQLSEERWDEFRKCFYFPIYAFGYNWTDSNEVSGKKLADFINQIIPHERTREGADNLCTYCIVVTHSMGGMVARWASEQAGAKSKILGIVHGAQPVTGTPSAYHQFRAGEDAEDFWGPALHLTEPTAWGQSRVIGSDAQHMDPIFGHCAGPMQLLPNSEYRTDRSNPSHPSSANWLFEKGQHGNIIAQLPSGSPFTNIYANMSTFTGFGTEASNVLPDTEGSAGIPGAKGHPAHQPRSASAVMLATVTAAADFHFNLSSKCHPNTFYSYGVNYGPKTYDEITYSWKRDFIKTRVIGGGRAAHVEHDTGDPDLGHGVDFDKSQNAYFSIEPKKSDGDGTVAASSATALGLPGSRSHDKPANHPEVAAFRNDSVIRAFAITDVEHGAFYQREEAITFTTNSIRELAQNYLCKKIYRTAKLPAMPIPPF